MCVDVHAGGAVSRLQKPASCLQWPLNLSTSDASNQSNPASRSKTERGQTVCPSGVLFVRLWFGLVTVCFRVLEACLISFSFSVFVFNLCFSKEEISCVPASHEEKEPMRDEEA